MTQHKAGPIVRAWWDKIQPSASDGRKGNPGALARLRRGSLFDAATESVTTDLYRSLALSRSLKGDQESKFVTTALIAAVLAHVRTDDKDDKHSVARAAGALVGDQKRLLSELRFRRLLATRGHEDCLIAFRRLVALFRDKANVSDLAEILIEWNDEQRGDSRRIKMAFDYFDAGNAAPDRPDAPAPDDIALQD
jgi:CRISPR system Cascade subunit CasB